MLASRPASGALDSPPHKRPHSPTRCVILLRGTDLAVCGILCCVNLSLRTQLVILLAICAALAWPRKDEQYLMWLLVLSGVGGLLVWWLSRRKSS